MLADTIVCGEASAVLAELGRSSIDLVFTSPPYFNARPEYGVYVDYAAYLTAIGDVLAACGQVLGDGRFLVINVAPVLVPRVTRNQASMRLAVPFDLHQVIVGLGFDFIDDIIWVKPEGAGWVSGRGRRFAADRNPMQYKTVPVTEYVLVYRKHSDKLIDWHIRQQKTANVQASKIGNDYERTNVWRLQPETRSKHPAAFPIGLAERVIKYYSFVGDMVLDPFAGSGTVGKAARSLGRRYYLIDQQKTYCEQMIMEPWAQGMLLNVT